ncbi:MAG: hypothetical protein ABI400_02005 [Lacisediminihabitans sp.]
MRWPRSSAVVIAAVIAVSGVVGLAGCSQGNVVSPASSPTATEPSGTSPTAAATAAATRAAPKFEPEGSAAANKRFFDSVNSALITANPSAGGKDVIDALAAAGFDKANMQVTPDKTTIGRAADSVLFSVRIGADCLLGQFSGSTYTSSVQAALKSGACLVGQTRPINW